MQIHLWCVQACENKQGHYNFIGIEFDIFVYPIDAGTGTNL